MVCIAGSRFQIWKVLMSRTQHPNILRQRYYYIYEQWLNLLNKRVLIMTKVIGVDVSPIQPNL